MSRAVRTHVPRGGAAALRLVDILNAPELAVLDVLEHAAHIARMALIAQHPHLLGDESGREGHDSDPIARRATQLLACAFDLSIALRQYRRALVNAANLHDDDFPF